MSYELTAPRELDERQKTFLSVLFHEAGGDPRKARKLAGYPDKTPVSTITNSLKDEIVEECKRYLASAAPSAIYELVQILRSEMPVPGAKDKLAAAKEILDRAGFIKQDGTQKRTGDDTRIVFMLPPKNENDQRSKERKRSSSDESGEDRGRRVVEIPEGY